MALQNRKDEVPLPAPTKRQSFMTRPEQTGGPPPRQHSGYYVPPTTYEDTPPSSVESLNKLFPPDGCSSSQLGLTDLRIHESGPHISVVDGEPRIQNLVPPDLLTSDIVLQNEINYQKQIASKQQQQQQQQQLLKAKAEEQCQSRVSTKIEQLLKTLKRPKKKPVEQFFEDDDGLEITQQEDDAPKPGGTLSNPAIGDQVGNMLFTYLSPCTIWGCTGNGGLGFVSPRCY